MCVHLFMTFSSALVEERAGVCPIHSTGVEGAAGERVRRKKAKVEREPGGRERPQPIRPPNTPC